MRRSERMLVATLLSSLVSSIVCVLMCFFYVRLNDSVQDHAIYIATVLVLLSVLHGIRGLVTAVKLRRIEIEHNVDKFDQEKSEDKKRMLEHINRLEAKNLIKLIYCGDFLCVVSCLDTFFFSCFSVPLDGNFAGMIVPAKSVKYIIMNELVLHEVNKSRELEGIWQIKYLDEKNIISLAKLINGFNKKAKSEFYSKFITYRVKWGKLFICFEVLALLFSIASCAAASVNAALGITIGIVSIVFGIVSCFKIDDKILGITSILYSFAVILTLYFR